MSATDTAHRRAAREGVPLVHQAGRDVVLVMGVQVDHVRQQIHAASRAVVCSSAGLARVVAERVLTDLRNYPEREAYALDAAKQNAEAAYRHACRRAGRAHHQQESR